MLAWAHRFATGLPCRASSLAGNAMLAALRVEAGMGCGSRPCGGHPLRGRNPETWTQAPGPSWPGCRQQCPITDQGDRDAHGRPFPEPPSGKRQATGAHRMPEAAMGVAVAAM